MMGRAVGMMNSSPHAAKQRWNAANYTQVKASVKPWLAEAFKEACLASGASMASVLAEFMASYSRQPKRAAPSVDPYATRKMRRKAVQSIIAQMELLALAEECYRDHIPENLKGSVRYEDADRSVATAYDAIDLLNEIY